MPETTDLRRAAIGATVLIVAAFVYRRSRFGRRLRATREDPAAARAVGVSALMALVLILRPTGLTGGRELSFDPLWRKLRPS